MTRRIGHGAGAAIAQDADAGHGEELGLVEDGAGDLYLCEDRTTDETKEKCYYDLYLLH